MWSRLDPDGATVSEFGLDYDESAANGIEAVAQNRRLSESDIAWLSRALVGAFRPNRDYPFFMLAHVMCVLCAHRSGDNHRRAIDDLLDPSLSSVNALAALFEGSRAARATATDVTLEGFAAPIPLATASRCLALAEFLMTSDDDGYLDIVAALGRLAAYPNLSEIHEVARTLGRLAHAWRQKHVPLAGVERQLRRIAGFLSARAASAAYVSPTDQDILDFFVERGEADERPVFRGVVELFLTIQRALTDLRFQRAVTSGAPVHELLPSDEEQAQFLGDMCEDERVGVEEALERLPASPRMLTGAERDALSSLLSLEPYTERLPLTVLRAVSYGQVQSGILNRLRRGAGGPSVDERARCEDAVAYAEHISRASELGAHLTALLRIAYAVRAASEGADDADPRAGVTIKAGLAALKSLRRSGFSPDFVAMREPFAAAEASLVKLSEALRGFLRSADRLAKRRPLGDIFEHDRAVFARAFQRAYLNLGNANDRSPA